MIEKLFACHTSQHAVLIRLFNESDQNSSSLSTMKSRLKNKNEINLPKLCLKHPEFGNPAPRSALDTRWWVARVFLSAQRPSQSGNPVS